MTTRYNFTVIMTEPSGDRSEFKTVAETPCKAFLAARELFPECEVIKVNKEGEWG